MFSAMHVLCFEFDEETSLRMGPPWFGRSLNVIKQKEQTTLLNRLISSQDEI
jgi:hypothetical protein